MELHERTKRRRIKAVVAEHIRLAEQDAKTTMEFLHVSNVDKCKQSADLARLTSTSQEMPESDNFFRDVVMIQKQVCAWMQK